MTTDLDRCVTSIVMPCYNAEKYISEAVESVLSQTFTDFELIIVDDGSTDNTKEMIRSYSDERITLIENKHESIITALNTGLQHAKGKYIARMDADDKMLPERLKMQYEWMETHPEITVCGSWMQCFNSFGLDRIVKLGTEMIEQPLFKLLNNSIVAHPTTMIRRDFLKKHDLQYENYPHAEDYKLWFEIARRGGVFYTIPEILLYYRISENQVSNKYSREQHETSNNIRKEILEHLMPTFETKNVAIKTKPLKPAVSVIMPAYNAEKYIQEAIVSMLNQTFENFEFIIINDHSNDETTNILHSLKDGRIITINNSSREGNCKSRNKGLELAKGKYICVMDADDISSSERLEKQYRFMEENNQYAALGSDMVIFDEKSACSIQKLRKEHEIKVNLLQDNVCTHPTLMLRNEFLQQNNIHYNEDYYYRADYNLLVDISRAGKITNMPEFLLFYRRHSEQISSSNDREHIVFRDRIQLKQLENFKVRPSIDEIIIHHALMNGYLLSERQLGAAEKWANKLIMKNYRLKYYDEEHLFRFLQIRMKALIIRNTRPGFI